MKKIRRMDNIPEKLLNAGEKIYYKKNEDIFNDGDKIEDMHILVKGELTNILYSKKGRIYYGFLLVAPCILSGIYQFNSSRTPGKIKVISDCEIIVIDKKTSHDIINSDIEIAKYVYKIPYTTLNLTYATYMEYISMSNEEKIINLIIEFAEIFGEKKTDKIKINHKLSQQFISNLTGIEVRTVANILKKLKDENILNYQNGYYYLDQFYEFQP